MYKDYTNNPTQQIDKENSIVILLQKMITVITNLLNSLDKIFNNFNSSKTEAPKQIITQKEDLSTEQEQLSKYPLSLKHNDYQKYFNIDDDTLKESIEEFYTLFDLFFDKSHQSTNYKEFDTNILNLLLFLNNPQFHHFPFNTNFSLKTVTPEVYMMFYLYTFTFILFNYYIQNIVKRSKSIDLDIISIIEFFYKFQYIGEKPSFFTIKTDFLKYLDDMTKNIDDLREFFHVATVV